MSHLVSIYTVCPLILPYFVQSQYLQVFLQDLSNAPSYNNGLFYNLKRKSLPQKPRGERVRPACIGTKKSWVSEILHVASLTIILCFREYKGAD